MTYVKSVTASTASTVRSLLIGGALLCALYVTHAYLRQQYHHHCSANLFKVVLLQRSDMCVQLHAILAAVEGICSQHVLQGVGLASAQLVSYKGLFFAA